MTSDKKLIEWGIAIGGSVLLHAAILSLFMLGGPSTTPTSTPAAGTDETGPAATASTVAPGTDAAPAPDFDKGVATAGAKDVMDASNAMSAGDFEQTARAVKNTKGASRTKATAGKPAADKAKPSTTKPAGDKDKASTTKLAGDKDKSSAAQSASDKDKSSATAIKWKVYTVQRGEGLEKIARQYGVTVQELAKANRMKPTQSLFLGQKIKIPDTPEK